MKALEHAKNIPFSVPFSLYAPGQTHIKTSEYEKITNHEDTFQYYINEYGFRFNTQLKEKNICFVGCSMTFGVGVDYEQTFPVLVSKGLGNEWRCMNLGVPGSGPSIQMANLTWALNKFKIDKIVWYMSDPLRQLVWNDHPVLVSPAFADDSEKSTLEYIIKNEKSIMLNTYWNLYTMFSLIKSKNIDTYFTCWVGEYQATLEPLLREFGIKEIGNMKWEDIARDGSHPGVISNKNFAERILKVINES